MSNMQHAHYFFPCKDCSSTTTWHEAKIYVINVNLRSYHSFKYSFNDSDHLIERSVHDNWLWIKSHICYKSHIEPPLILTVLPENSKAALIYLPETFGHRIKYYILKWIELKSVCNKTMGRLLGLHLYWKETKLLYVIRCQCTTLDTKHMVAPLQNINWLPVSKSVTIYLQCCK